jgi:hypothetical protein
LSQITQKPLNTAKICYASIVLSPVNLFSL